MSFLLEEKQGLFFRGLLDVELNLEEKEGRRYKEIFDVSGDIQKK